MLYDKIVSAGEEFTIHGLGKDGKLDTNIYINGIALHTSCSKPICTGMHIGTFTITAGESVKGGALCTIENFENKDKKKKKEK